MMNFVEVFERFPDHKACLDFLEEVRWDCQPVCPYCDSIQTTVMKKENRHHCNACNTSFSVTVNTILHKTRLPLQKWLLAVSVILNANKNISARRLARDLKVNKDTAWRISMKIREAMKESHQRELLMSIVEMDEMCAGGRPRKRNPSTGYLEGAERYES